MTTLLFLSSWVNCYIIAKKKACHLNDTLLLFEIRLSFIRFTVTVVYHFILFNITFISLSITGTGTTLYTGSSG